MDTIKILGIVGSLRKESFNKKLMNAVKELAPEGVVFEIGEIGNLPLFDQDMELTAYPAAAQVLKDKMKAADGILIVTPEYGRSIPGVLKNALDWTSRPYGTSAWPRKVVAAMGATGGNVGTALAQAHLRQILLFSGSHVMGQPEFYLTEVAKKFDAAGVLTDEPTKEHIKKFWDALLKEIGRGR